MTTLFFAAFAIGFGVMVGVVIFMIIQVFRIIEYYTRGE